MKTLLNHMLDDSDLEYAKDFDLIDIMVYEHILLSFKDAGKPFIGLSQRKLGAQIKCSTYRVRPHLKKFVELGLLCSTRPAGRRISVGYQVVLSGIINSLHLIYKTDQMSEERKEILIRNLSSLIPVYNYQDTVQSGQRIKKEKSNSVTA